MLLKKAVQLFSIIWLFTCSSIQTFEPSAKRKDLLVRKTEKRERGPEPNNQINCTFYDISGISHSGDSCMVKIWDQNGTFVNETSGNGEHELCYYASGCYYVEMYSSISSHECIFDFKDKGGELKSLIIGDTKNLTQVGYCSSGEHLRHHLLLINATSDGVGFNYKHHINDEMIDIKNMSKGDEAILWIDIEECNTINGTGNATYRIYHHDGELYSIGEYSNYYSFGKCTCDYKSLFLSSHERGQGIMTLFSSTWGMEVFTNVTSPQYMSACWIINYDLLQLNANDENIIQRYIMVLLFHSTNGWNWDRDLEFLSAKHECDWNYDENGFFCDNDWHGIEIHLDNNNLEGHLISELYDLNNLENLTFQSNQLSGSLPFGISQLKLKKLNIGFNNILGSIPKDLLHIDSIEEINIRDNRFTGSLPNVDTVFINLKSFEALGNRLTGTIPDWIGTASKLEKFRLESNLLHGTIPHFLFEIPELRIVYLGKNKLSGSLPSNIFMNEKIAEIRVTDNHITGTIPTEFGVNCSIDHLFLYNNLINGTVPRDLFTLPKLEELRIYNNSLSGSFDFNLSDLSLDDLRMENNNLVGNITNCYGKKITADCDNPRKVDCECCQCYGFFNTPTAYEEVSQCTSSEIAIFNTNDKVSNSFYIRNKYKEYLVTASVGPGQKYVACLSETGSYTFRAQYWNGGGYMSIDNTIVLHSIKKGGYYDISYNGNHTLALNACDNHTVCNVLVSDAYENYEVCNVTLISGMHQRRVLDRLFKLYQTRFFMDTASLHYKTLCWWLEDVQKNITSNYIQRYVLALLHNTTGGEHWNNDTNWLSNKHECQWYGIDCDDYDNVLKVNLTSNNLNGPIPTEIGELKTLKELMVGSNNLTGIIPNELTKLERIEKLDLSSNLIQGSIPSYIGFLTYLKDLNLSSNVLTNTLPLGMSNIQGIQHINLSNNSFSGELSEHLSNFSKLKVLNISNNLFQGNVNALKVATNLSQLDLSHNYFMGNPPIFGSVHDNLEILHANGNMFSGSIPAIIGEMLKLKELFLHGNELFGTLASEVGKLKNISKITVSYNKLKGKVPEEIGNLNQLELLHLHSNELVGTADYFGNHLIKSFISDCGSTVTRESLVQCKTCTECCNQEDECVTEAKTWPRNTMKSIGSRTNVSSAASILIFTVLSWLLMIFVVMFFFLLKDILPQLNYVYHGDQFQKASVHRFLLSSNKIGWIISCMTIIFQIWVTYIFFRAGDRTESTNEWMYSVSCPSDSIDCSETRRDNALGWISFSIILSVFTIPDILDGIYLIYESSTSRKIDIKGVFFGVVLTSVPIMCIVASVIYLYATSVSNAAVLKDSIAILFLSEIDEQVLKLVIRVIPTWVNEIERDIATHANTSSQLNASVLTNEVAEHENNAAIDISDEQSIGGQNNSSNELDSLNDEENNVVPQMNLLNSQIQELKKERENERMLNKLNTSEDINSLAFQVETLTSQMQKIENVMKEKDLIILEMWKVLSREHFQFADTETNKTIDVGELHSDSKFKTTQNMEKEAPQLKEFDFFSKRSPTTSLQLNSFSARQVKAQEFDTKINDHCEHFCSARRSSLDIFESNEMDKLSSTSNNYTINRSPIEGYDKNVKSSLLVTATNEAKTHNNEVKSYSEKSLATPHAEVVPPTHVQSHDFLYSEGEITANSDPVTMNDAINTTCADENTAILQSEATRCDSGVLFRSFDLQFDVDNGYPVHSAVFMTIDASECTFGGDGN